MNNRSFRSENELGLDEMEFELPAFSSEFLAEFSPEFISGFIPSFLPEPSLKFSTELLLDNPIREQLFQEELKEQILSAELSHAPNQTDPIVAKVEMNAVNTGDIVSMLNVSNPADYKAELVAFIAELDFNTKQLSKNQHKRKRVDGSDDECSDTSSPLEKKARTSKITQCEQNEESKKERDIDKLKSLEATVEHFKNIDIQNKAIAIQSQKIHKDLSDKNRNLAQENGLLQTKVTELMQAHADDQKIVMDVLGRTKIMVSNASHHIHEQKEHISRLKDRLDRYRERYGDLPEIFDVHSDSIYHSPFVLMPSPLPDNNMEDDVTPVEYPHL